MKTFHSLTLCLAALLALGFLNRVDAANPKVNSKAPAASKFTNTVAEVAIPQSVFDFSGKSTRDPFFPTSTRTHHVTVQATNEVTISPSIFKLKGLSGTPQFPLALINNRTVANGETATVTTATGKHKIHCLQIKQFSVIMRVEGQFEPIEIFLPKGDR